MLYFRVLFKTGHKTKISPPSLWAAARPRPPAAHASARSRPHPWFRLHPGLRCRAVRCLGWGARRFVVVCGRAPPSPFFTPPGAGRAPRRHRHPLLRAPPSCRAPAEWAWPNLLSRGSCYFLREPPPRRHHLPLCQPSATRYNASPRPRCCLELQRNALLSNRGNGLVLLGASAQLAAAPSLLPRSTVGGLTALLAAPTSVIWPATAPMLGCFSCAWT